MNPAIPINNFSPLSTTFTPSCIRKKIFSTLDLPTLLQITQTCKQIYQDIHTCEPLKNKLTAFALIKMSYISLENYKTMMIKDPVIHREITQLDHIEKTNLRSLVEICKVVTKFCPKQGEQLLHNVFSQLEKLPTHKQSPILPCILTNTLYPKLMTENAISHIHTFSTPLTAIYKVKALAPTLFHALKYELHAPYQLAQTQIFSCIEQIQAPLKKSIAYLLAAIAYKDIDKVQVNDLLKSSTNALLVKEVLVNIVQTQAAELQLYINKMRQYNEACYNMITKHILSLIDTYAFPSVKAQCRYIALCADLFSHTHTKEVQSYVQQLEKCINTSANEREKRTLLAYLSFACCSIDPNRAIDTINLLTTEYFECANPEDIYTRCAKYIKYSDLDVAEKIYQKIILFLKKNTRMYYRTKDTMLQSFYLGQDALISQQLLTETNPEKLSALAVLNSRFLKDIKEYEKDNEWGLFFADLAYQRALFHKEQHNLISQENELYPGRKELTYQRIEMFFDIIQDPSCKARALSQISSLFLL